MSPKIYNHKLYHTSRTPGEQALTCPKSMFQHMPPVGNFLSASRCLGMHRDGPMPGRPHRCIETSHKRIPMQTECDGSGIGMPSR